MKVAIVHEWLVDYAGSEKVLTEILNLFPDADLFSVVDFLTNDKRKYIHGKFAKTSFIQRLPLSKKHYNMYLALMPIAVEQLDLSRYDLIISSSHAVAKGILTGPDQVHISYVHSPIRYAWDLQATYLKASGLHRGIRGFIAKIILHYIRLWDYRTSNGVDAFIANSEFIARRIWKIYRRQAKVIYPPVDIESFTVGKSKENFYVTVCRLVPYKRVDLIVEAFNKMPDKKLYVLGNGSDFDKIAKMAGDNVVMMGYQPDEVVRDYLSRAKGFVFAAEEDFGISVVEAQASGTPVIALNKGGAVETVRPFGKTPNPTGTFFDIASVDSIVQAVKHFESFAHLIDAEDCRSNAVRFSSKRFRAEMTKYVEDSLNAADMNQDKQE